MTAHLALYQEMASAVAQAKALADAGRWDEFMPYERQITGLRQQLQALTEPVDAALAAQLLPLIESILEQQQHIERLFTPRLEQLRLQLASDTMQQRIDSAYAQSPID